MTRKFLVVWVGREQAEEDDDRLAILNAQLGVAAQSELADTMAQAAVKHGYVRATIYELVPVKRYSIRASILKVEKPEGSG